MKPIISPSILSANFAYLANDIEMINGSEAGWVHIDIMDGVFVPNISFGFPVLKYVAKLAEKPLDVHLMIVQPEKFIPEVKALGARIMNVRSYKSMSLLPGIQRKKSGKALGTMMFTSLSCVLRKCHNPKEEPIASPSGPT